MDENEDIVHLETRPVQPKTVSSTSPEQPQTSRVQRIAAVKSESRSRALAEEESAPEGDESDYDDDGQDEPELKEGNKKSESSQNRQKRRNKCTHEQFCKIMDRKEEESGKLKERVKKAMEKYQQEARARKIAQEEADEQIKGLKEQLNLCQSLVEEMDENICKLQAELVDRIGSREEAALPDNVVRIELAKLFTETKSWAETWVVGKWDVVGSEDIVKTVNVMKGGKRSKSISELGIQAIKRRKIPPRVLLNAIVNKIVCHLTICNPFRFLQTDSEKSSNEGLPDQMDFCFELIKQRSQDDYFGCRLSLLRAVHAARDPSAKGSSTNAAAVCEDLKRCHCNDVVERVLRKAQPILRACREEELVERNEQLFDLVSSFFQKSIELQAQEPHLTSSFRQYFANVPFELNDERFVPHRMMKLKEDEDDHTGVDAKEAGFLGRAIDLVVEPLIMRFGDADGSNRDKHRIVHQATVWMIDSRTLEDQKSDRIPLAVSHKTDKPVDTYYAPPGKAHTSKVEPPQVQEPRSAHLSTTKVRQISECDTQTTPTKKRGAKTIQENQALTNKRLCVEVSNAIIPITTHEKDDAAHKTQKQHKASSQSFRSFLPAECHDLLPGTGTQDKSGRKPEASDNIKREWQDEERVEFPEYGTTPPLNKSVGPQRNSHEGNGNHTLHHH